MIVLKIILWIILIVLALIILGLLVAVLALSVKITVKLDYGDSTRLKIKYGFIGIPVYPEQFTPEKIEKYKALFEKLKALIERIKSSKLADKLRARAEKKKLKKEKKAAKKPEEPMTLRQIWAKVKEVSKKIYDKTKNIFTRLGFDGIIGIVQYLGKATTGMFKKLLKHIVIKEMYLGLTVAGDDAANTAMKYGETCAAVFPSIGLICTNMKVRKYDVDVSPDFLAVKNSGEIHLVISFRPILLLNVLLGYLIKVLNKVVFKVLFSKNKNKEKTSKKVKNEKSNENIVNNEKTKINLGGA